MNKKEKLVEKIRKYFGLDLGVNKTFGPTEKEEEFKAHMERHNEKVKFNETHKIRTRILFPLIFFAVIIGGSILVALINRFLIWLGNQWPTFCPFFSF